MAEFAALVNYENVSRASTSSAKLSLSSCSCSSSSPVSSSSVSSSFLPFFLMKSSLKVSHTMLLFADVSEVLLYQGGHQNKQDRTGCSLPCTDRGGGSLISLIIRDMKL